MKTGPSELMDRKNDRCQEMDLFSLAKSQSNEAELIEALMDPDQHHRYQSSDGVDRFGRTPLMYMIDNQMGMATMVAIENGLFSLDTQDVNGDTALNKAVDKGMTEVSKLIVNHGGKITLTNRHNINPFTLAALRNNNELVRFFFDRLVITSSVDDIFKLFFRSIVLARRGGADDALVALLQLGTSSGLIDSPSTVYIMNRGEKTPIWNELAAYPSRWQKCLKLLVDDLFSHEKEPGANLKRALDWLSTEKKAKTKDVVHLHNRVQMVNIFLSQADATFRKTFFGTGMDGICRLCKACPAAAEWTEIFQLDQFPDIGSISDPSGGLEMGLLLRGTMELLAEYLITHPSSHDRADEVFRHLHSPALLGTGKIVPDRLCERLIIYFSEWPMEKLKDLIASGMTEKYMINVHTFNDFLLWLNSITSPETDMYWEKEVIVL